MASFLRGMKKKAGRAMGFQDKESLEAVEKELYDAQQEIEHLREALEVATLELSTERALREDLESTLESMKEEDAGTASGDISDVPDDVKELATKDCQLCYEALRGLTTDDSKLVDAIASRSSAHTHVMKHLYLTMFGKDLPKHLKKNTGGNLRIVLLALLESPALYEVGVIRGAMKGIGSDETVLIEALCPLSNAEIVAVKALYAEIFQRDLLKDVTSNTSGEVKKLFTIILQGTREDDDAVDAALVKSDAAALFAASEGKTFGKDMQPFLQIICNRSPAHLRALNSAYRAESRHSWVLVEALTHYFGGKERKALLAVLEGQMDRPQYYAGLAYYAMKGVGCDELTLIRVILTRREKDLDMIQAAYNEVHKRNFVDRVATEVSGDLKSALLAIITQHRPEAH